MLLHIIGTDFAAIILPQSDDRQGPLAPLGVRHADHRRLLDRFMHAQQALQLERADPLPTALDHILQAVDDLHVAVLVHRSHVTCMQPAAIPQEFAHIRVFIITLRKPWGAYHNLPTIFPILGNVFAVIIDHPQVDHRDRHACFHMHIHLLVLVPVFHIRLEVRKGQHRCSFGHAIARVHLDTQFVGLLGQALGQAGATDDHLPTTEVELFGLRRAGDHL